MKPLIPPDRDPELRRAFALDAAGQRSMLAEMLGDRPVVGRQGSPSFEHVGVTTRRTVGGSLSCRPNPFPAHAVLTSDSPELLICIDNRSLRQSQPRRPETIEYLERAIAAHAPKRGIVRVPYAPPRLWTVDTIRAVIDLMLAHLPPSPSDKPDGYVRVMAATKWSGYASIECSRYSKAYRLVEEAPFSAEVRLAPEATGAIQAWRSMFNNDLCGGGHLNVIDHVLARNRPKQAEPLEDRAEEHGEGPDDDLDPIERAARRALHGAGDLRRRAAASSHDDNADDALNRIADKLGRLRVLPRITAGFIENLIDLIIKQDGQR
jgi:hypothetical protein